MTELGQIIIIIIVNLIKIEIQFFYNNPIIPTKLIGYVKSTPQAKNSFVATYYA